MDFFTSLGEHFSRIFLPFPKDIIFLSPFLSEQMHFILATSFLLNSHILNLDNLFKDDFVQSFLFKRQPPQQVHILLLLVWFESSLPSSITFLRNFINFYLRPNLKIRPRKKTIWGSLTTSVQHTSLLYFCSLLATCPHQTIFKTKITLINNGWYVRYLLKSWSIDSPINFLHLLVCNCFPKVSILT